MVDPSNQPADRRKEPRFPATQSIRVRRTIPILPLSDAAVLNVSAGGVAIRTRVPLKPGDRLSFTADQGCPPILAEVLAVEPLDDGYLRARCRCLLGGFDVEENSDEQEEPETGSR